MKQTKFYNVVPRVVSIIMFILMVLAMLVAISGKGSGFLDLSNIVNGVCIIFAIITGIIGVITAKFGWGSSK